MILKIRVKVDGKCVVGVRTLLVEGLDEHSRPILTDSISHNFVLPASSISYPVHVVPNCNPFSTCTVFGVESLPEAFDVPCFGPNGDHVLEHTHKYILNPYFVK